MASALAMARPRVAALLVSPDEVFLRLVGGEHLAEAARGLDERGPRPLQLGPTTRRRANSSSASANNTLTL